MFGRNWWFGLDLFWDFGLRLGQNPLNPTECIVTILSFCAFGSRGMSRLLLVFYEEEMVTQPLCPCLAPMTWSPCPELRTKWEFVFGKCTRVEMLELGTGKENFRGSCNGKILHNLAVSYLSPLKRGKKKKGNFFLV